MATHLAFHFDPACPFCWITSKWVRQVQEQRDDLHVDWRFIALRILNEDADYDEEFPEHYLEEHTRGLEMLRVCAAARDRHGPDAVGRLYAAMGDAVWEQPEPAGPEFGDVLEAIAAGRDVRAILDSVGLDTDLAEAVHDERWDAVIREETAQAQAVAGDDVGTPILRFDPDGADVGFFGPVISALPPDEDAVKLWNAVETLAYHPSFAELKRSLRDVPDLPILADVRQGDTPEQGQRDAA